MFRFICFLIVITAIPISSDALSNAIDAGIKKYSYKFKETVENQFYAKSWKGTWISETSFWYENRYGDIMMYDAVNQTKEMLIDIAELEYYNDDDLVVELSPDLYYALIKYNESSKLKHPIEAYYSVMDIYEKTTYHIANQSLLQGVQWSNDNHSLAYVLNNDIYYLDCPENVDSPRRITFDGLEDIIFNGGTDYNYDGNLQSKNALWFSPDDTFLAFAQFNDSEVGVFEYNIFGKPGSMEAQYPYREIYRYSKAGSTNPTVRIFLSDLTDYNSTPVELPSTPDEFLPDNYFLWEAEWPNGDEVSFHYTNRVQNVSRIIRCSINITCWEESLYETENGWTEISLPLYSENGTFGLQILPAPEDNNDTYYHLMLIDFKDNSRTRLTFGKKRVTEMTYWDKEGGLVYYQGIEQEHPSREHTYVVNVNTLEDRCFTCNFSTPSGPCLHARIEASYSLKYYTKICKGPGPDYILIVDRHNDSFVVWEKNAKVISSLKRKLEPQQIDLTVPIADGFEARARLLLPPSYSDNDTRKYPAIVKVYAGPDDDMISDKYERDISYYWVTHRNYIHILIDGRGCGRHGIKKMYQVYRRLGTVEIEDQINVTRYLQAKFPKIDRNNTGIWGWSYGGFAAASALAMDHENVFKFGMSVAPVTNFLYHASTYTERYMCLPTEEDNLDGYERTDLVKKVKHFRGKSFLLVHGNADDNVHYQHTMTFIKALELADIPFYLMSYPDENHDLQSVYLHLHHTLDAFIMDSIRTKS